MTDVEIANTTQNKFEFYLISLVFTLLALSIQTAKFDSSIEADIFELIGWVCLFISGVVGLWRIEYLPVERMKMVNLDQINEKVNKLNHIKDNNPPLTNSDESTINFDDKINELQKIAIALKLIIQKLSQRNMYKYYTHKITFIIGILSILISRGFEPFINILCLL